MDAVEDLVGISCRDRNRVRDVEERFPHRLFTMTDFMYNAIVTEELTPAETGIISYYRTA